MALFDNKKEKKEEKVNDSHKSVSSNVSNLSQKDTTWVLSGARLSEKAIYMADKNVYVFNVSPRANKKLVSQAVFEKFNVRPKKVNIVTVPRKKVQNRRTGIKGKKSGGKKAYVYLKEGDTINLI